MDRYVPIKLAEGNLSHRHKFINLRVHDAIKQNVPFEVIKGQQVHSAVDRLFVIDFASKCKNLEYIIETLKDRNMLFVTRALKSNWLITDPRHADIINPKYLEDELFPQMMTTAANKMLRHIYIHLKDEIRCHEFYQHYKLMKNIKIAKRFLPKCSIDIILKEIKLFLDDMTPHYLKLICEKCPEVYKQYFNVVNNDEKAFRHFNAQKTKYFNVSKIILKIEPEIYFDMLEQYYDTARSSHRLSPKATKRIMQKHKDKFAAKPELYGGVLLHLPTLARCLSEKEAQDLVERLARAQYLAPWFKLTYKSAEPLLKRIGREERFIVVNKIFKENTFGELIHKAPYSLPKKIEINSDENILSDLILCFKNKGTPKRKIMKKKCFFLKCEKEHRDTTLLDQLFDKYRFTGFFQTFYELKKRLQIENSHQNRLMILNVLVSKTMKRVEYVQALLELVSAKHANEPITLLASFVRSLVRRAAAYRLPNEPWQIFQEMVQRIIFQSENQEVPCDEGVHAILIHNILNDLDTESKVLEKFNTQFNPLVEYDLTASEKRKVFDYLYQILLNKFQNYLQNSMYKDASGIVYDLLHLLRAHKVNIKTRPEFSCAIKKIVEQDLESCQGILEDLYKAKVWRDMFTRENFILRQNEESYMNALRHDVTLLVDPESLEENMLNSGRCKFNNFLRKLKLYFEELTPKYLLIIEKKVKLRNEVSLKLARPLCILQEPTAMWMTIRDMYAGGKENRQLAERLVANAHMAWLPDQTQEKIRMDVGVIASRNALGALPASTVRARLPELLAGPPPFVRLALTLTFDRLLPLDILKIVARLRHDSNAKTKRFLLSRLYKYMGLKDDDIIPDLWTEFKNLMVEMIPYYNRNLWDLVCGIDPIAEVIKMEYCMTILKIVSSENFKLRELNRFEQIFIYIRDNMEKVTKDGILDILQYFHQNKLHEFDFMLLYEDYCYDPFIRIKIMIMVRLLLTCDTETVQNEILENVVKPFLITVRASWNNQLIRDYFELFLSSLKYNKAFLRSSNVNYTAIFEAILKLMKTFLDVKRYFYLYSRVHLTMIYRETLKRLQQRHPYVLAESTGKSEAAEAVGAVLAGYLAREHRHLLEHYFPTITDIYARDVCYYVNHYRFGSGDVSRKFKISVVRGLIANENDESVYFAASLFLCMGWHRAPHRNDPDIQKIWVSLENCKSAKVKCCLNVGLSMV